MLHTGIDTPSTLTTISWLCCFIEEWHDQILIDRSMITRACEIRGQIAFLRQDMESIMGCEKYLPWSRMHGPCVFIYLFIYITSQRRHIDSLSLCHFAGGDSLHYQHRQREEYEFPAIYARRPHAWTQKKEKKSFPEKTSFSVFLFYFICCLRGTLELR